MKQRSQVYRSRFIDQKQLNALSEKKMGELKAENETLKQVTQQQKQQIKSLKGKLRGTAGHVNQTDIVLLKAGVKAANETSDFLSQRYRALVDEMETQQKAMEKKEQESALLRSLNGTLMEKMNQVETHRLSANGALFQLQSQIIDLKNILKLVIRMHPHIGSFIMEMVNEKLEE